MWPDRMSARRSLTQNPPEGWVLILSPGPELKRFLWEKSSHQDFSPLKVCPFCLPGRFSASEVQIFLPD